MELQSTATAASASSKKDEKANQGQSLPIVSNETGTENLFEAWTRNSGQSQ